MIKTEWTEEEDQYLIDMINMGWTYRQVASGLNVTRPIGGKLTRNAIAGRKSRLILKGRDIKKPNHKILTAHANRQKPKPKPRKERVVTSKIKTVAPAPEPVRVRSAATGQLKPVRPGVLPMVEGAKTITELGYRQCRAAVGEAPRMHDGVNNPFMFCAAPTREGETYCDEHAGLMYAAPKPKAEGDRGFILSRIGTNKGAA